MRSGTATGGGKDGHRQIESFTDGGTLYRLARPLAMSQVAEGRRGAETESDDNPPAPAPTPAGAGPSGAATPGKRGGRTHPAGHPRNGPQEPLQAAQGRTRTSAHARPRSETAHDFEHVQPPALTGPQMLHDAAEGARETRSILAGVPYRPRPHRPLSLQQQFARDQAAAPALQALIAEGP